MSRLEDRYLGLPIEGTISNDISGMYDNALDNSVKLKHFAEENGIQIRLPQPDELFIDLDTERAYELFKDQLEVLRQVIDIKLVDVQPSKSGLPKRHAVVAVRMPMTKNAPKGLPTLMEKLALQTMLGSDRRCELLRYVRYCFDDPDPILFLEKKNG